MKTPGPAGRLVPGVFADSRGVTEITAGQAQPGDVVLAPGDEVFPPGVYQAPSGAGTWFAMQPTGDYGPVPHPQGTLVLLVRGGRPVIGETT